MRMFELRLPPPVMGLMAFAVIWWLSGSMPGLKLHAGWQHVAGPLALVGGLVCLAAFVSLWRARTTINPLHPDRASHLVTTGAYRYSRNPMYLGMLVSLTGWALYLLSPPALCVPVLLGLYLHRFQVLPEERVLLQVFGERYAAYAGRVRRWL